MRKYIPELIVQFTDHGFDSMGFAYNNDATYRVRSVFHHKDGSWSLVTLENTTIKVRAEATLDFVCLAEEED